MVRHLALVALLAAAGCQASLGGDGTGGGNNNPDGGGGSNGSDSGSIGQQDASVDAAPACANNRRLFLEFLGVTLTDDANSDATQNRARWLTNATATVPPWRQGAANRATQIQEVVDGVKARLSQTPIEVVTTRPATGPYVMVVLGGRNTGQGGSVGTVYSYATSFHDCGDTTKSDVAWVSDMNDNVTGNGDAPTSYVADLVVGAVGWSLGLDGTTDANNCMCGWTTLCNSAAGACTLSASIASGVTNPGAGESACQNGTQNEVAAFSTGFCAP